MYTSRHLPTEGGDAAEFLDHDGLLHVAHAEAVVLLGEADADEAALSQSLVNVVGRLRMLLAVADLGHLAGFDLVDAGRRTDSAKSLARS